MENLLEDKFESILIVSHTGLSAHFDKKEFEDALPGHAPKKRHFIEINVGNNRLEHLYDVSFDQWALVQTREFQQKIEPWLKKNPNAVIAYFGLVPIPLAIHLGYLLQGFNKYWVFQHHHKKNIWYQNIDDNNDNFKILPLSTPEIVQRGKGDVMIRISTSYRIDEQHSYHTVQEPMAEFDIALENTDPDAFSSQKQIEEVGNVFQTLLGTISNYFPKYGAIHLLASVPCGLAFILGTKTNPNIISKIITYQHNKGQLKVYKEALVIPSVTINEAPLTEEEIKRAHKLRKIWSESLNQKIIPFISNQVTNEEAHWYSNIDGENILDSVFKNTAFDSLPGIAKLSLRNDEISLSETTINNGFSYEKSKSQWILDDALLSRIEKRSIKKAFDRERAGRLFLFHEGLHYSSLAHNLIQENAEGIGRFPKVIEEADYQADVYALLNEWNLSKLFFVQDTKNIKAFFMNAIDVAVETMWSFMDNGKDIEEFQIRSMNRLLNWYWQWAWIETKGNDVESIVKILLNKPTIELAGPKMKLLAHRTFYLLKDDTANSWQLASFYNNRIYRFTPNQMESIIEGFKKLDGDMVKNGIKSFIANIG